MRVETLELITITTLNIAIFIYTKYIMKPR
jgi:hypothetical protein